MPSTRLIAVFAVACINLNVAAAIATSQYPPPRASKLPVYVPQPMISKTFILLSVVCKTVVQSSKKEIAIISFY
jgi:hypothetical protein